MSTETELKPGTVAWRDLTVRNTEQVRDFYEAVVGWQVKPHDCGEYEDYEMLVPETGECVAGVCHARDANADLPPQWLIYVVVADVDASAKKCKEMGGQIVTGPRPMGHGQICVIRDPAGAVCALWKPG